jgi:hypothetical protein
VCNLDALLSVICCLFSKHGCWFRGTKTSSSGRAQFSELVWRAKINSKGAIVMYHFMLQDRIGGLGLIAHTNRGWG